MSIILCAPCAFVILMNIMTTSAAENLLIRRGSRVVVEINSDGQCRGAGSVSVFLSESRKLHSPRVCWGGIWFRRTSPPRSCTISVDKPSVCLNHNVSLLRKRGRTWNKGDGAHLYTCMMHASQSTGEKKKTQSDVQPSTFQTNTHLSSWTILNILVSQESSPCLHLLDMLLRNPSWMNKNNRQTNKTLVNVSKISYIDFVRLFKRIYIELKFSYSTGYIYIYIYIYRPIYNITNINLLHINEYIHKSKTAQEWEHFDFLTLLANTLFRVYILEL